MLDFWVLVKQKTTEINKYKTTFSIPWDRKNIFHYYLFLTNTYSQKFILSNKQICLTSEIIL